jgi:hypothetical protein
MVCCPGLKDARMIILNLNSVLSNTARVFPRDTTRTIEQLIAQLGNVESLFNSAPSLMQTRTEKLNEMADKTAKMEQYATQQLDLATRLKEKYKKEAESSWLPSWPFSKKK